MHDLAGYKAMYAMVSDSLPLPCSSPFETYSLGIDCLDPCKKGTLRHNWAYIAFASRANAFKSIFGYVAPIVDREAYCANFARLL
jgi:hypothetical protein